MNLYIGLMSGTSMDGIDAVLVNVDNHDLIAGFTYPYSLRTQLQLQAVLNKEKQGLASICQLNTMLGQDFALAVNELLKISNYSLNDITAIGSHGQTICHDAFAELPYTLQLGCAHTIAELTGIDVVADFRTRDLILGGQGAPFAPIYHQALFAQQTFPVVIINIGGIANLTCLTDSTQVMGYDIGPGNCLMDGWIYQHHHQNYDAAGGWAAKGKVIPTLLQRLLDDPFFKKKYPKSIGKEYFSLNWLKNHLAENDQPVDVQATLCHLTAITIANAVDSQLLPPKQLYICGGGVHNLHLLASLKALLPTVDINSTQAININPDFIEAQMFAWLAEKAITHKPVAMEMITGAKRPAILGAFYPAGIDKRF